MEYTEKIHAEGLLKILSNLNPCGHCPSGEMRLLRNGRLWDGEIKYETNPQCEICWDFIGATPQTGKWGVCPCYNYQEARANKLTWIALEEKGYI